MSNDTPYSVPAVWSVLYNGLKHSPWQEGDDITALEDAGMEETRMPAAAMLKQVYDYADTNWAGPFLTYEAPLAVLKAAHRHHGSIFLTPGQVMEMARNFSIYYEDPGTPFQKHLDKFHGEMPLAWLNDLGRSETEESVRKKSEIWIEEDEDLSGTYVFNKPGHGSR